MKNKNKLILFIGVLGICWLLIICINFFKFDFSYSGALNDDARVKENSDLTYYLDIGYDGKDKNIVMSSDTATAEVKSDYIYVEDKIPSELVFKEFVTTSDGSIGAVESGDSSKSCSGYVVDGINGLEYDSSTRTVSFKIKNLQAGCKITVGIVTTTPTIGDTTRMDFYNTAFAKEGDFGVWSNTAHVFLGEEDATMHNVVYKYVGDVPENVPSLPDITSYISGATVNVLNGISIDGYLFSGWTSSDVSITDNSFVMPDTDVVLEGSFTKKDTYTVSYSITGDIPDGYLVPKDRNYGVGDDVVVDSLKVGDEINGYRFLGWSVDGIDLSEGIFTMPKKDVKLVGKFEKISYKVTYKFQGSIMPANANELLPKEKDYYPGDTVKVANDLEASGYRFLGWYSEKSFIMPEDDVVIYGEWKIENGLFSPIVKKEIINKKNSYNKDEVISSIITIENTASYPINNVIVEEDSNGGYFVASDGYEILNNRMISIPTIAAGKTVTVKTEYAATSDLQKKVISETQLTGALAGNNYYLDTSKDYKATVEFVIFNPVLKINLLDKKNNLLEGYEFGLYSDKDTTNLISKGVEFNDLEVGKTYYLRQLVAPSGYSKINKVLTLAVSEEGNITIDGYDIEIADGVATLSINNNKLIFTNLPNTLDSIVIYLGLFIVSIVCVVGIFMYIKNRKKRVKNNKRNK